MSICDSLIASFGELFSCDNVGPRVRVRTPYLYPDGDYIDVFAQPVPGGMTLSDLGETTRWLRMQSISARRSARQRQLIDDVCLTHGVEFYRGMLTLRTGTAPDQIAASVTRLAQAALRVSDLWFTFRSRVFETVTDEVAEFLFALDIPFDRGVKLVGRSGRGYSIDFQTRALRRSSLIAVLSTGSRSAAGRVVDHVVTAWVDLNHLKVGQSPLEFVSLFDDTLDVWRPEEFRLLEECSTVARWSNQDELKELLTAA